MQYERRTITQTVNIPTNTGRTVDEHVQAYLDRAANVMDSMGISMWPATVSDPGAEGGDDALDSILDGTSWIAANCQTLTDDSNGIKVTSRATGHAYLAWAYGTSHMTARSFPLTPGDVGLTLTNERFAEEFQAASF